MKEIIITLVFSIVLLLFMFYPAIKIMEYIEKRKELSRRTYMAMTLGFTVALSLIGGTLLRLL